MRSRTDNIDRTLTRRPGTALGIGTFVGLFARRIVGRLQHEQVRAKMNAAMSALLRRCGGGDWGNMAARLPIWPVWPAFLLTFAATCRIEAAGSDIVVGGVAAGIILGSLSAATRLLQNDAERWTFAAVCATSGTGPNTGPNAGPTLASPPR